MCHSLLLWWLLYKSGWKKCAVIYESIKLEYTVILMHHAWLDLYKLATFPNQLKTTMYDVTFSSGPSIFDTNIGWWFWPSQSHPSWSVAGLLVQCSISKTGKFRHWKVDNTLFYKFWAPRQSNINSTQTWGRHCIRIQDGKPSQSLGHYCMMTPIFSHLRYSHGKNWIYYK